MVAANRSALSPQSAIVVLTGAGISKESGLDTFRDADGIWSKVRTQLDPSEAPQLPVWSGYTCFAAIANCVPDDIADVGYKVFLGPRKYFVSVDVGEGRIQWYAFLNIPAGESPKMEGAETLEWLKTTQFDGWSPEVHQLIDSTPVVSLTYIEVLCLERDAEVGSRSSCKDVFEELAPLLLLAAAAPRCYEVFPRS